MAIQRAMLAGDGAERRSDDLAFSRLFGIHARSSARFTPWMPFVHAARMADRLKTSGDNRTAGTKIEGF
jgi:hypothetical protein